MAPSRSRSGEGDLSSLPFPSSESETMKEEHRESSSLEATLMGDTERIVSASLGSSSPDARATEFAPARAFEVAPVDRPSILVCN